MDIYQKRYLKHQAQKRDQLTHGTGVKGTEPNKKDAEALTRILENRRSQRVFIIKEIEQDKIDKIIEAATKAPNACNRHGVLLKLIRDRKQKELLTGIIVGGVGWIHRADTIILFLADPTAYKSPREKTFMHFCDVGFTAMPMWLTAESLGLGVAYVNPNMNYPEIFDKEFGQGKIFCGLLAIGNYEARAKRAERPKSKEITI